MSRTIQTQAPAQAYKKPPLGLMPRYLAQELGIPRDKRTKDVTAAIARYEVAQLPVPSTWTEELRALTKRPDYSQSRLFWPPYSMCTRCRCTAADCRVCVERTGEPCSWVTPYLCSACDYRCHLIISLKNRQDAAKELIYLSESDLTLDGVHVCLGQDASTWAGAPPPPTVAQLLKALLANWDEESCTSEFGFELNVCGPNYPEYLDVSILASLT